MKPSDIYSSKDGMSREKILTYLQEKGWKIVAFRPPLLGEHYLLYYRLTIIMWSDAHLWPETEPRLIVERI